MHHILFIKHFESSWRLFFLLSTLFSYAIIKYTIDTGTGLKKRLGHSHFAQMAGLRVEIVGPLFRRSEKKKTKKNRRVKKKTTTTTTRDRKTTRRPYRRFGSVHRQARSDYSRFVSLIYASFFKNLIRTERRCIRIGMYACRATVVHIVT